MWKFRQLYKEQSGMTMILVSLGMFMIMGFSAIVVDAGMLYLEKSRLQKALDAAVLGGAQLLKNSEDAAEGLAIEIADKNGYTVTEGEIKAEGNSIEIEKKVTKGLFFARVLGFTETDVAARAKAEIQNTLLAGSEIVPVAVEVGEYDSFKNGNEFTLNFHPGQGNNEANSSISGNFGFLAIDGPGGNDLKEGIMNGSDMELYDPTSHELFVWTKTGLSWGNVKAGFEYRINEDKDKDNCQRYVDADNTCERIVTIPLIETFENVEGKSMVKIVGFAAFYVERVQQHKVIARFKEIVRDGTFGPGKYYGISGVKLVN
ncbi:Tad domain-containing protein [Bacillus sp. JJ1566]|uniref:Tad domain-containing protein n=1 Tax=Bacillus sp. JJ1566 TaxID=3122961 RepID=UPI002FFDD028